MKFTWSNCPHCKKTINFEVEGGAGRVQDFGKATVFDCPKCKHPISDGLKEWSELTIIKKWIAIFRILYTALLYGFGIAILMVIVFYFVFGATNKLITSSDVNLFLGVFFISTLAIGYKYIPSFIREINESNERIKSLYNKHNR